MSFQHWPFEDILLGVQSAQLTRELPIDVKILICNMSIGLAVYCVGAREPDFELNDGIKIRRDINCLVKKFSSEQPKKEDWICWPCLDFYRKSEHRTERKFRYKFTKKPQRSGRAQYSIKKNYTKVNNKKPELLEGEKNSVVIQLRLGEFPVNLHSTDNRLFFSGKSSKLKSSMMRQYPHVRNYPVDISNSRSRQTRLT